MPHRLPKRPQTALGWLAGTQPQSHSNQLNYPTLALVCPPLDQGKMLIVILCWPKAIALALFWFWFLPLTAAVVHPAAPPTDSTVATVPGEVPAAVVPTLRLELNPPAVLPALAPWPPTPPPPLPKGVQAVQPGVAMQTTPLFAPNTESSRRLWLLLMGTSVLPLILLWQSWRTGLDLYQPPTESR
jgi:hypothetical protein